MSLATSKGECAREQELDRELQRRVTSYLATKHLPNLRRIEVCSSKGEVTLRGRVDSFHEKQIAIHSCQRVAGVHQLVDALEVDAN